MHCPSCTFENPEGKNFCEECGATLVRNCPSCGAEVRPAVKFCGDCGTALLEASRRPAAKKRTRQATPKARTAASPTVAPSRPPPAEAERRQLTVAFIDLVGSTQLSAQLDPEDYRAVVQDYQQTCVAVLQRHGGYLAQTLGDGLLVYFGYPTAHEDDARRAVRTGLEIVESLRGRVRPHALPVRIGIHTGLVVIGEIGVKGRTEQLALGETPNIAARLQGLADPNMVIISAATYRLLVGQFDCRPVGSPPLKGLDTPIAVYHVQSEREGGSPLASKATLTPLVGREQEVGLLLDRWEQVKEGRGQVVLLSGEPGIGKSRLAHTLGERVTGEGSLLLEARCSPYHQHSALYPLIEVLQRTFLLTRQDADDEKVEKVERALTLYNLQETVLLFTALLSLPTPVQYPSLNLTPQKQKERTLQALVQLFIARAERQATVAVWEDLHWADPSSLEFVTLLIEQLPTTRFLLVLTFRPEFTPPWKPRSHISQLVLNRLGQKQVEAMIEKVTTDKELSVEVIEQIRVKTDGVPLFVEELTKSVVETIGVHGRAPAETLAIPATLHEALLARLDRLSTARQVAQLGATLGREFSYELLHAMTPLGEADLQAALGKLVEAEILYQRGVGQQTRYFFKHALIQDAAYQSLLKSTRQQYHQQIAQVLEERFPATKETQPEILAHHYTEAGLLEQAVPYWQKAGEKAARNSANVEAITHLTTGLDLLKPLPATPEHAQQELTLQTALGPVLIATKGYGAPETEGAWSRAYELCQQLGETSQLFPVLWGLLQIYVARPDYRRAREYGEQMLSVAQCLQDPSLQFWAYRGLAEVSFCLGECAAAKTYSEHGVARYDSQQRRAQTFVYGEDPAMAIFPFYSMSLCLLGYPDQALRKIREAQTLARELAHANSMAFASFFTAFVNSLRGEHEETREQAEAVIELATEQRLPFWLALGTSGRGWALVEQDDGEAGIAQIRQGLATFRAAGSEESKTYWLARLAEAYRKRRQLEEGCAVVAEALEFVERTEERFYEAELYRLKGQLTLQSTVSRPESQVEEEAEEYFRKAIEIARKQQAKSLELRAVMSMSRLWHQQGKKADARRELSDIYNWFTEGFETKDLQEAKALLEELH